MKIIRFQSLIFFVFACMFVLNTNGQKICGDFYPYHLDESVINDTRDSLLKAGVRELIVFQNSVDSMEAFRLVNTFLIWNDFNNGYIKIISDSMVFKTQKCSKFSSFMYPNIRNTMFSDKFDKPNKFVAPVIDNTNRFVIYSNKTQIFSFVSGHRDFDFIEDKTRKRFRKEFADMIEKEISNCKLNRQPDRFYKRLVLFSGNEAEIELINKVHERYTR